VIVASSLGGRPASGAGDDFDDGVVDPLKWQSGAVLGNGWLDETNGRLEWRVSQPTELDETDRYWRTSPTVATSWEMQIKLWNFTEPDQIDQVNSFGIWAENGSDPGDWVSCELYSSSLVSGPWRRGFYSEAFTDGSSSGWRDSLWPTPAHSSEITSGAVRIVYQAATRVLTCYYDPPGGGPHWVGLASFGVGGTGGATANVDWELSESDTLLLGVYGYSTNEFIASGEVYGDDFVLSLSQTEEVPALGPVGLGLAALLLVASGLAVHRRAVGAVPRTPAACR
jgi:hypothetical protein